MRVQFPQGITYIAYIVTETLIMDALILKSFIPETFFSIAILFQLIYNVRLVNNFKNNFPIISKEVFSQTLFILLSLFWLYENVLINGYLATFSLVNDNGSILVKILTVGLTALTLIVVKESFKIQKLNFFEFYSLLLLSVLSLLIMISASDLIIFYLAMEMQALCFYVLASFNRDSVFSSESGLKYFVSGSFISGFFLLGVSFIYGAIGTINFNAINLLTSFDFTTYSDELRLIFLTGVILVTCTLLFKLACAPFHFWSPDVYDGAPLSSTLIFSVVPKFALFYFFIKWINCINVFFEEISMMLLIAGILSTIVGTFFGLTQKRLKRLIIYSSIAQTGFLVASLSLGNLEGVTSVYFFLIIYLLTSILMWGHVITFYGFYSRVAAFDSVAISSLFISSLSNLSRSSALWCFSFVVVFFSIAGIPPLTGFLSKMLVLFELVTYDNILAAIILLVVSAVSVYYYIRFVKTIYFEPKKTDLSKDGFKFVLTSNEIAGVYPLFAVLLFALLVLFYFPTYILLLSQYVAISTF